MCSGNTSRAKLFRALPLAISYPFLKWILTFWFWSFVERWHCSSSFLLVLHPPKPGDWLTGKIFCMHSLGYGTRGLGRTAKVTNFLFISLSFHCRTFCKLIKSFMLPCRCRNLDLSKKSRISSDVEKLLIYFKVQHYFFSRSFILSAGRHFTYWTCGKRLITNMRLPQSTDIFKIYMQVLLLLLLCSIFCCIVFTRLQL